MPPNYGFNTEWTEPFANVIPAVNGKVETPIGFYRQFSVVNHMHYHLKRQNYLKRIEPSIDGRSMQVLGCGCYR
jgi:hypothetical protein